METAEHWTRPEIDLDAELETLGDRLEATVKRMLRGEWDLPDLLADLRDVRSRLSELERLRAEERRRRREEDRRRRRSLKAAFRRQP